MLDLLYALPNPLKSIIFFKTKTFVFKPQIITIEKGYGPSYILGFLHCFMKIHISRRNQKKNIIIAHTPSVWKKSRKSYRNRLVCNCEVGIIEVCFGKRFKEFDEIIIQICWTCRFAKFSVSLIGTVNEKYKQINRACAVFDGYSLTQFSAQDTFF